MILELEIPVTGGTVVFTLGRRLVPGTCAKVSKPAVTTRIQWRPCSKDLKRRERTDVSIFKKIHHVAVIATDYPASRKFYVDVLGLKVISEQFREQRNSYKLDLALPSGEQIELFSFPDPPLRVSNPEAAGLRHLAFAVDDLEETVSYLSDQGVPSEPIRIDELTGKRFTFFRDPDDLPLELYEM